MSIEESNELIVKFIGGKRAPGIYQIPIWDIPDMPVYQYVLYYDSSWDWFMSALFKCQDKGLHFTLSDGSIYTSWEGWLKEKVYDTKSGKWGIADHEILENAYKAIVDFIIDYNKQNNV